MLVCKSVASLMKSLLGPKSMEKLLVRKDGSLLLTNDGATTLANLVHIYFFFWERFNQIFKSLEHPVAKLLAQLSLAMDEQCGDGKSE